MPTTCAQPGCYRIVPKGRCEKHSKRNDAPGDPFYSSSRWRKLRAAFLSMNPLCARCKNRDRLVPANEVHHKQKRTEHPELSYEWSNLEALCKSCHSRESARGG